MYACVYACMYVCMYVCMCVYIYIYIYIYIYVIAFVGRGVGKGRCAGDVGSLVLACGAKQRLSLVLACAEQRLSLVHCGAKLPNRSSCVDVELLKSEIGITSRRGRSARGDGTGRRQVVGIGGRPVVPIARCRVKSLEGVVGQGVGKLLGMVGPGNWWGKGGGELLPRGSTGLGTVLGLGQTLSWGPALLLL